MNNIRFIRGINWRRKIIIENREIQKYANSRYGEKVSLLENSATTNRCFIIGNGPSLRTEDLETLYRNKEICFGANRIYGVYDKTNWRPNYWGCQDTKVWEQIISDFDYIIENTDNVFLTLNTYEFSDEILEKKKVFPLFLRLYFDAEGTIKLSKNARYGLYEGMTITYTLAQIAIYMGFKEIYFLGVDNSFAVSNKSEESDRWNYFSEIKPISHAGQHEANPSAANRAYEYLEKKSSELGVKFYNATRGGKVEAFKRIDFDSLFMEDYHEE